MLSHVTFTGWDDRTDFEDLAEFCRRQRPGTVEVAVLLSSSRMGEDRYPGVETAENILRVAKVHGQRTAVHVCGQLVRLYLGAPDALIAPGPMVQIADRVQANVPEVFWPAGHPVNKYAAAMRLSDAIGKPVIVQVRDAAAWPTALAGVQYLFDRSGGRGEVAEQAPPLTGFPVGYAGGLGPDNVHAFLDRLRPMTRVQSFAPIWIDMESGIRESMSAFPGGPPQTPAGSDKVTPAPTFVSVAKCQQVMDAARWALLP